MKDMNINTMKQNFVFFVVNSIFLIVAIENSLNHMRTNLFYVH